MNKALLASTAIVGAALLSAPAMAGSVGTGKNYSVNLNGMVFFQGHVLDGGADGFTRGYGLNMPEAELWVKATNKSDNGITYGVRVELEVNTNATGNADEIYAFLKGDFGAVTLGDQDGVSNQWLEGAHKTHAGASGPFGGLMGLAKVTRGLPKYIARTDWQPWTSADATKITYQTPKFSGFQAGISFTPDHKANGSSFGEKDNNGSYENIIEMGLKYGGKFNDVGFNASIVHESADAENAGGKQHDVLAAGARLTMGKISGGANFRDNGDLDQTAAQLAAGGEGGSWYAVGGGYNMGKGTKASIWYGAGSQDVSSSVSQDVTRWGLGFQKVMAPGWLLRADYNSAKLEKTGAADNDQQAVILTNFFIF